MKAKNGKHVWRFYRAGGIDQVMLRTGADIGELENLDQKLWTALSCPTRGVRFDGSTMTLLDSDKDGRIRVPEIFEAVAWLKRRLTALDSLLAGSGTISLSAFNTETAEGRSLLANAKRIMASLGKPDADAIALADVTNTAAIFANTRLNGDGVIPADATDSAQVRQLVDEIIGAVGAVADRSGKPGVDRGKVDIFFGAVEAYRAWSGKGDATVLPLGDKTAAAAAALAVVRVKIDDYFTRCSLAQFDCRAAAPLNRAEGDFAVLAAASLNNTRAELDSFPISRIEGGRDLPLYDGINPYWVEAVRTFRAAVVTPLLGEGCDTLSAAQWQQVKEKLQPYEAWMAARTGAEVEALGAARLEELSQSAARHDLEALIAEDAALAPELAELGDLERLLRYHANLDLLLDNFVNMSDLYDPQRQAIFQMGTLYMDARACSLCFHVDDIGAHAAQAAAGKCCLAYCNLTRPATRETRQICAVFTAGFARTLWVGRNGIFYDRDGRDWEAVVVKLLDNPISLKEAFWDPWRKIADMIGNQIRKMLESKNEAVLSGASQKIEATAAATAIAPGTVAVQAPAKMEGAALASSVAAIGIAVGLVGSAIGGLVSVVAGLPPWKTALGILAVILVVSGPSVILTWFKLRARDLAPILNACGWAINRPLRMSLKLARLFTMESHLPPGSEVQLVDPYADKRTLRRNFLLVLLVVAMLFLLWLLGVLNPLLPATIRFAG